VVGKLEIVDDTGQRVRLLRMLFTATRQHIARSSGVSLTVLNKLEQNKYSPSQLYKRTVDVLAKVAHSVGANPDWVIRATPPLFARRLTFVRLNLGASRRPIRFERDLTSASFVRQVVSYLVEAEEAARAWVFTGGDETFFGLECSPLGPRYAILFTDRLVKKSVVPLLLEKNVRLFIEDSDVAGFYGKRPEAAGVLKACLRQFYEEAVTGELVTRLRRVTEAFVATCAEPDDVISSFGRFLEGVTETDVASPVSLGTHVKAERIAQFIRDIAASPEDVGRALDVLHWQLPGS
jgi:transcriptional regulator with XRE-family HTH domain